MQEAILRSISDPSKAKTPRTFASFAGEPETVLKRHPKDPARNALVWANLWYGKKKRRRVTDDSFNSPEIPPHERQWHNVDWKLIEDYVKP